MRYEVLTDISENSASVFKRGDVVDGKRWPKESRNLLLKAKAIRELPDAEPEAKPKAEEKSEPPKPEPKAKAAPAKKKAPAKKTTASRKKEGSEKCGSS